MPDSPRIEELKRRVQLDPASIAFAALAEEYRRTGRYEEAIDVCRTGLQRHPSYISAHVTLGRALFEVGQYDDARKELEYVLTVAPENLAAIRGLAEIHHRHHGQSSEGTDLTATEMADMLAVPHPAAPLRVEPWIPPPPVEPVVETFQPSAPAKEESSPEPSSPVMETVPLEAMPHTPVPEPQRQPEPEPQMAREPEPEPIIIYAVEPEPPTVDLPIAAIVTPSEAPAEDPALERLETFLHAIHRARESAGGIRAS